MNFRPEVLIGRAKFACEQALLAGSCRRSTGDVGLLFRSSTQTQVGYGLGIPKQNNGLSHGSEVWQQSHASEKSG